MAKASLAVDLATVATRLNEHLTACERRYQESNQRLEKLFTFMEKAHGENRKDIGEIKDTLAEQRGAGKLAKFIGATGAGLMGIIGGIGGSHFIK